MKVLQFGILMDESHRLIDKIKEFLETEGHKVEFLNWKDLCYHGADSPTNKYDVVYIDRLGEQTRSYLSQLHTLTLLPKTNFVNKPLEYSLARDKSLANFVLHNHKIPVPPTFICHKLSQVKAILCQEKTLVIKSTLGVCAEEVFIVDSKTFLDDGVSFLLERDGIVVAQSFIHNPERYIWRVDIVNDKIVVCNQRYSFNSTGLPLCNGTQGGEIKFWNPKDVPPEVRLLALATVDAFGLEIAGVDIIPNAEGNLKVLEVNPEPDITLDRYEFPAAIAKYLVECTLRIEGRTI